MIRLARLWFNAIASVGRELALLGSRWRDRSLRRLEQIEKERRDRETQREIGDILTRADRQLSRKIRSAFTPGGETRIRVLGGRIVRIRADDTN